jgi:hypothetical protein
MALPREHRQDAVPTVELPHFFEGSTGLTVAARACEANGQVLKGVDPEVWILRCSRILNRLNCPLDRLVNQTQVIERNHRAREPEGFRTTDPSHRLSVHLDGSRRIALRVEDARRPRHRVGHEIVPLQRLGEAQRLSRVEPDRAAIQQPERALR